MTFNQIVYLVFILMCLFLMVFVGLRFKQIRQVQAKQKAMYDEKRESFKSLTSEVFDKTPTKELTHAVIFHIMAKEDRMYDREDLDEVSLITQLTHPEILIYTIYLTELSVEGGRASIHSFFIDEKYKEFVPYLQEAFTTVKCFEIANLLKSAARLAYIIEHDLEDEETVEDDDFASYNFADYTTQLLTMIKSSAIIDLTGNYIREHKEDFIDKVEE